MVDCDFFYISNFVGFYKISSFFFNVRCHIIVKSTRNMCSAINQYHNLLTVRNNKLIVMYFYLCHSSQTALLLGDEAMICSTLLAVISLFLTHQKMYYFRTFSPKMLVSFIITLPDINFSRLLRKRVPGVPISPKC